MTSIECTFFDYQHAGDLSLLLYLICIQHKQVRINIFNESREVIVLRIRVEAKCVLHECLVKTHSRIAWHERKLADIKLTLKFIFDLFNRLFMLIVVFRFLDGIDNLRLPPVVAIDGA